ncbi:hypothetical protein D7S89_10050 [Trinickia fusca]|uniref:Uncharacterized protein n=2 Tax=Trinickia fusca TaxID=2419777 RepID=A0A494XFH6_9BURK|nr:hypothetical protein D7S89_10050 [Trinickia fusca]
MAAAGAAAVLLAGCAGVVFVRPSFTALQQECGPVAEYGEDGPAVYSAFFDAYVAYRHGRVSKDEYCAFERGIAEHHAALGSHGAQGRGDWATFFNGERVKAIDWRASVDPTLRGG